MVADIGKTLKTVSKEIYVHNITVEFKQHDYKNTKSQSFIFAMMRLCANAHSVTRVYLRFITVPYVSLQRFTFVCTLIS